MEIVHTKERLQAIKRLNDRLRILREAGVNFTTRNLGSNVEIETTTPSWNGRVTRSYEIFVIPPLETKL